MNDCFNHPKIEALSICHGCGKEFCKLCLGEGKEYYYCKSIECQELLKMELPINEIPLSVICPKCETKFELSEEERSRGNIYCSECDKMIDYTVNPPKLKDVGNYTELVSTLNQGDIALIKSILENGNINYYTLGEVFLSVRPLLEPARFFVAESQIKEAQELFKDFDFNIYGIYTK